MRGWILAVVGAAALVSLPAHADHHHYGYYPRPYVGFSYSYGYPFYPYYGLYSPWYSPWYGPGFGVGVHVDATRPHTQVKEEGAKALKLYVYPSAGQTEAQLSEDRYQCHTWAVDQTHYDPTLGTRGREDAEGYTRAFTACMEGRNYVVK
jgi:hypothetical protein